MTIDSVPVSLLALRRHRRVPGWGLSLLVLVGAELLYFTLTTRHFAQGGPGLLTQAEYFTPTGVLALGLAMVILTGNIDLSAGAVASLTAVVAGASLQAGDGVVLACLFALLVGAGVGLCNGLIVALLGIDSLLVTLATQFIVLSVSTSVAGDSPPYNFPSAFQDIGRATVADVPYSMVIFLGLALITVVVVNYTNLGRSMTLIGYNQNAARYTGITTRRALTASFVLSGLLAGVAGILIASYFNSAQPDAGIPLLLPAITAVVLGGVDIFGGRGRVGEVVVAVLLLGYLSQGLQTAGYSALTASMVTGLLLIAALVVKVSLERFADETTLSALRRRLALRTQRLLPGRPDNTG